MSDHDRVTIVLTPELAVAQIERLRIELEAKDFVISCQRVESDRPRAKLAASEAACAPFLKDGETPAECIARWRGEALAVLELLRQERVRSEKAEAACAQMREALQGLEDWLADCDDPELVDDYDRACGAAAAALATDAGRGWVSTEGAVEAVPSYVFNTDNASVDGVLDGVRLPAIPFDILPPGALSRVAAGEDVEQVMRDYGWERKP